MSVEITTKKEELWTNHSKERRALDKPTERRALDNHSKEEL
jgi:hypothetical protein